MRITLNGVARELPDGARLTDAAALLAIAPGEAGVAAAVDGTVIRRSEWDRTDLTCGCRVEIVRAAAGG